MLVDVKELNYLGTRIPREARPGLPVTRGTLTVDRLWSHSQLDKAPVHAHLTPPVLEPLYGVKLRYWRGRTLVLVGEQRAPLPKRSKAEGKFDQVWLCRIVTEDEADPPAPGPAWPTLDPS